MRAARLRQGSARVFVALGGSRFARRDVREKLLVTPWMLEFNPNCGVYYPPTDPGSADLILSQDPEGHVGFTERLVESAFRRHAARQRQKRVVGLDWNP